ncbi:hypothetical protein BDN70DRAFT_988152 [Pholiota conissans]|uniref:F-box domain-containing protein n=1 Tax=Pholiota conissans TaxID=109636 RepID=A0A9P5ZEC5_9AGAR|nr:hypothetical protein BDN70DRAFT_988152 [Pholiota conissans]
MLHPSFPSLHHRPMETQPPFDITALLPFYGERPDDLQKELWVGGKLKRSTPFFKWPRGRDRGNYIKSYLFMNLRIEAKSTRPRLTCHLDVLLNYLPNELIGSIFGLLHPIDLYHAIRATKALRLFLLDKNSASIWRESFLNHPDIPFYPDDVSPPKWVSLIFGPATCDICGRGNSLVEYALRVRRCNACKDYCKKDDIKLLTAIQPILAEFPEQQNDIWRLAVKVHRSDSYSYPDTGFYTYRPRNWYSIQQTVETARMMRQYLVGIRSGLPEAKRKYETFVQTTDVSMQQRFQHSKSCNLWASKLYSGSRNVFSRSTPIFIALARKELQLRGHNSDDVAKALRTFEYTIVSGQWATIPDDKLKPSNLRKYLPQFEAMVNISKRNRSFRQRNVCKFYRRQEIATCFKNAKMAFPYRVTTWAPSLETLYNVDFFVGYINDPQESVGDLDTDLAEREIFRLIDEFIDAKKRRLCKILLDANLLPAWAHDDSKPDESLALAIAVFECCGKVFLGWEEAAVHICKHSNGTSCVPDAGDSTFKFHFSDTGYKTLEVIASLLRLDSLGSVLRQDLDRLDRRFVCKACTLVQKSRSWGLTALTWRECLAHALVIKAPYSTVDPRIPEFDILSEDLTRSILRLEQPFPPPSEDNWYCNHCTSYLERMTRSNIINHVYKVHGISQAAVGVDIDYHHTPYGAIRYPIFIGLDENANHRCLQCTRTPKVWLKKDPDLYNHFMDKHRVEVKDLVEGVDWMKIKVVEDDSWIQEKIRLRDVVI